MDDSKIEHTRFRKGAIPLDEALRIAEEYRSKALAFSSAALIVGSVLRRKEVVGDVDILILPRNVAKAVMALEAQGFRGDSRIQRKMVDGVLVEIYLAHSRKEMGALQLYLTGDIEFVRELRAVAKDDGWDLTPYGLFERGSHQSILQSPDERDFFDALGLPWTAPERRGNLEAGHILGVAHPENRSEGRSEMFPGMTWDFTPFRPPDYEDEGKVVWYGPDGPKGLEWSKIQYEDWGWRFIESSIIGGDKDRPRTVYSTVTYEELAQAALEKSMVEIPIDTFERSPDAWARFAAVIGAIKASLHGGDRGGNPRFQ